MCEYCNIPLYIKVQQYARPILAPMTCADERMDEYTGMTGMAYIPLQKRFCPMCGRKVEVKHENT